MVNLHNSNTKCNAIVSIAEAIGRDHNRGDDVRRNAEVVCNEVTDDFGRCRPRYVGAAIAWLTIADASQRDIRDRLMSADNVSAGSTSIRTRLGNERVNEIFGTDYDE